MPIRLLTLLLVGCVSVSGCADRPAARPAAPVYVPHDDPVTSEISLLFIGNSHTHYHDLPGLVCRMMRHRMPGKTVDCKVIMVGHLDQAAANPDTLTVITSQKWTHVILQAQMISTSGKFLYSTKEGVNLAIKARENGSTVHFFAEWARKGIDWERKWTEDIYAGMAKEANACLIPVGRAWEAALAEKPDLPLHDFDGNHESATGAFLTACVIAAKLSGEPATAFADLPGTEFDAELRSFLAKKAATVAEVR